jgi:hypothetical protein
MRHNAQRVGWILLLWLAAGLACGSDRLYLWEVKGPQASVHLFGSVHLCRADCFPLPAPVVAAFERAHYLALELDPTKPGVQEALLHGSLYGEGDSLERHVSPQLIAELQAAAGQLGVMPEALRRMKPWMAGTTLTVLGALRAGYKADEGIDLWFLQRARGDGKAVIELETVEQQVESLGSLPAADQERILAQAVTLVRDGSLPGYLDGLIAAWRSGDTEALHRLSQAGMEDAETAERVIDDMLAERNRAMSQRIVRLIATGRPGFVVVGALHLAGRHGIVEMLRQRGYPVRQLGGAE